MQKKARIGVFGAGVFGGYHANKCAEQSAIDFVGIYDPAIERAQAHAEKHGVDLFADPQKLMDACDGVIIASPAHLHAQFALHALNSGCHCLIEKPLAATVSEGERLIQTAKEKSRILQVGHQERFVIKATGLDAVTSIPTSIHARRFSPYSPRGTDVSVQLDLMTHDIDLVLWLMRGMPDKITGNAEKVRSDRSDYSIVKLNYENTQVTLEASRVEDASERFMHLTYPEGDVKIDFNAKSLDHDTPFDLHTDFANNPMAADSLGAATEAFVSAILHGTPVPVSGEDGLNALKIALAIRSQT